MRTITLATALLLTLAACSATPAPTATTPAATTAPPTVPASPSPASPSPTLPPTASPTVPASPSPTTTGTATEVPESPGPSPTGGLSELFTDDFSDPTSGFAQGENEAGTASYADGSFQIANSQAGAYVWSRRLFEAGSFPIVRAGGQITALGEGIGGILCGGAENHLVGILVATDGRWFAVEITPGENRVGLLEQGTLADNTIFQPDTPLMLTGECSVSGDELSLILSAGDRAAPLAVFRGAGGPDSFDRVALYAEALSEGFSMLFDDVAVSAGESGGGLVERLMGHVPVAYRDRCEETPPPSFDAGALVAVACFLQSTGAGAEIVEYVLFDSTASMQAAYQQRVETWGADSTGSTCREGPTEGTYSIDQEQVGSLLCAAQTAGIRYDWTDGRVNILTTATDFEGSYEDLYQTWQEAGPDL